MTRISFRLSFYFSAATCLMLAADAASAQLTPATVQTIPSMPLASFQNSLGVNTHIEYTDGRYANATAVLNDLRFLGIHNLRDGIPDPIHWLPQGQAVDAMHMLAANGIKFDFVSGCNGDFNTQMQQLDAFVQAYPGTALSVEGANEINNWPCQGSGGNEQAAETFQRRLYSGVHGNPHLSGVPVYYMTGAAPVNLQTQPGLADTANTHPYPYAGVQPFARLESDFNSYFMMKGSYPKAITETGYATLPYVTDPDGVNEPAQAEMLFNIYFDAALQGVSHTYIYQLLDPYPDQQHTSSDSNFGLFHLDNSPKIVAYALHNMADIFPADKPSPKVTVSAAITGLPAATGHALALTASDGTIALFMWNEAPVWDKNTQTLLYSNPLPVQVQMAGSWNVSYFTPAEDTTFPVQQVNGQYNSYVATYPTALIFRKK